MFISPAAANSCWHLFSRLFRLADEDWNPDSLLWEEGSIIGLEVPFCSLLDGPGSPRRGVR